MEDAFKRHKSPALWQGPIVKKAVVESFKKLDPRHLAKNPVMFVVEVGSVVTTWFFIQGLAKHSPETGFAFQITAWLWFTVLFANFAEAMAEGRGKAQADALRKTKTETVAKRLLGDSRGFAQVPAAALRKGDLVLCETGDVVPADGEVVEGVASVDESAVTGESAPVIRESGGDRSSVTGGTKVNSDWLKIRVTANPGEGFLDKMIGLVEGAQRQKTPNEIALNILLAGLTLIFLVALMSLQAFAMYSGGPVSVVVLVALLVCLIPTTIGGLLSAIGIAGIDRLMQANVLAMSGRAVEAAGDVDTLLLDKTGTITLGNRMATEFVPAPGVTVEALAQDAQLASLSDETPEGRSIVVLAKQFVPKPANLQEQGISFIPFSANTRLSGVDLGGVSIRKGAMDAVAKLVSRMPAEVTSAAERIAKSGGTPLVVSRGDQARGVIHLKDVVKGGIRQRFEQLRAMGIGTIMITGDNPLTAAAIAAESGVDDFLAQATPEKKLELIRTEQAKGRLVAMVGDGTNDAPSLAQADVGVAMNSGTMAAKEAGNMVDLDSNPTKLIEIVEVGKQLLMTRGSLTTFSVANDVSKYFAIIPAMFMGLFPQMAALNVMRLHSPQSAILASVIFNALIIVALIPLALRGVKYRAWGAHAVLRYNALVYGVGGLIAPFVGIKLIDLLLVAVGLG